MSNLLRNYASQNVKISWLGLVEFEGYAADTFVEIALNANRIDAETGSDGLRSRSISPDKSGSLTITLQQQSPTHTFLSYVAATEDGVPGTLFNGAMTITDPSGSMIALLEDVCLMTEPTMTLGSTATGNNWSWGFDVARVRWVSNTDNSIPLPQGFQDYQNQVTAASALLNLV